MQEMIEKERVNEVVSLIKKTPKSKITIELLKEFKMIPEQTDTAEDTS